MGRILSNILGLPRHGACRTCDEPIAEGAGNQSGKRWQSAPRMNIGGPVNHNRDGSVNVDRTRCDDDPTGEHRPAPGSLW